MIKNILLKIANKIINKYGVHEINLGSILKFQDAYFFIHQISYFKELGMISTLDIKAGDYFVYNIKK